MKKHLSLTQAYLLSFLLLAMWAFFAYLTMHNQIQAQERYAELINISGKQRMLSQRTALLASQYLTTSDLTFLQELRITRSLMEKDHNYLLENIPSDSMKQVYLSEPLSLDVKAKRYFALLDDFTANSNAFVPVYLFERSSRLLPDLDYAVKMYEEESDLKSAQLMKIEGYILFGTILTLLLEAIIIIRPTLRFANLNSLRLKNMVQEKTEYLSESLDELKQEIDARKKAEADLALSEDKYRTVLNNQDDAVFLHEATAGGFTSFTEVNQHATEIYGYSKEQLLGMTPRDLTTPEEVEKFDREQHLEQLLESGKVEFELLHKKSSGELFPVHIKSSTLLWRGKKYILSTVRDMSAYKKMEVEKEKLLSAIYQTGESIVITDALANIQYVNPAFESITGYAFEEVLGQNPRILQSGKHDKGFYKAIWKDLSEGRSWKGEIVNQKKDGSFYTEEATISPVNDDSGNIVNYVAVKSDVTEKKANEQQLRLKNKMEAVGYLAGGIAHNFNNNLSVILGNVEMAMMKYPNQHEAISFLENAKIAVGRSRDLVQGILSYSRQDAQEKVSASLLEIVNETISLLQATIPSTIKITQSHLPECASKRISAAPSQVQEILINLCNNAVHAMDEVGTLSIDLEPRFLSKEDIPIHETCLPGNYAKLSVKDSGCGIPKEILDNIFDPFFTTKEMYEGTGMGLATVQGIVAQHGGMIQVESQPGLGTTFHMFFPRTDVKQTSVDTAETEKKPVIGSSVNGTEHILFVDDDEMLAELGDEMLTEGGYRVTTATSSTAALKLFEQNPEMFDLVITDQTMPDLCGRDLANALKRINDKIPVVLCTGFSSKVDEKTSEEQGIDAFLMKPLEMNKLLQSVRQILDAN